MSATTLKLFLLTLLLPLVAMAQPKFVITGSETVIAGGANQPIQDSQILKIPVQTKGMYIVKIGSQTVRAVVR